MKMRAGLGTILALALVMTACSGGAAAMATQPVVAAMRPEAVPAAITKAERGAVVETERYRATIADGALVSFVNKLTGEQYVDPEANPDGILPHLPGGMGTQAGEGGREIAAMLWEWPWKEHAHDSAWSCHRWPTADSKYSCKREGNAKAVLTYTGLTNGAETFAREVYGLEVEVDGENGDLLLTPFARSRENGVYSASLTVLALAPGVTVEAPIFDGMRLTRDMPRLLYLTAWPGYWDYGFAALNGHRRGAVGIWCQDAELRVYKHLLYLNNDEGLSLSFCAMNTPPFEKLEEARPLTWRVQAFDKSWAQAAARFRSWRLANVKIAPRADWARRVSAVMMGVNASKGWLERLLNYFGEEHADRVACFAPVIRAEGFDRNHANNTPYEGFKKDMVLWKEKGPKLMAYLQPMIMWSAKPKNKREEQAVKYAREARTHSVFRADPKSVHRFVDQHHLGHAKWQRWFLDWVGEYIKDYGANGVYHDQSYSCPTDRRGLGINKMTSPQGMADYFYKAQAENPNSIHGTEHMNECNGVGASLSIGAGILWGPAHSLRHQRIRHASAVSNALHYPNGVIYGFPHFSNIAHGNVLRYHWGMDQMERRAEIPGVFHEHATSAGPREQWAGEYKLERTRAMTFVRHNLRPVFPENWDPKTLSYFRGAEGEDFRYERTPWGTVFVRYEGEKRTAIYGRIHGVAEARAAGSVLGWPVHLPQGPAGLNPTLYYVLEPEMERPSVYFEPAFMWSTGLYESYVQEGYACDAFAYAKIEPIPEIGKVTGGDNLVLRAPSQPVAIYVDGKPVKLREAKGGGWAIGFNTPASIVALVQEPPTGLEGLEKRVVLRLLAKDRDSDLFDPVHVTGGISGSVDKAGRTLLSGRWPRGPRPQLLAPFKAPEDGTLKIAAQRGGLSACAVDGVARKPAGGSLELPMKAGEVHLLTLEPKGSTQLVFEWAPKGG